MQKNTYKYLRNDPQQGLVEIRWDFDTVWDIDEGHSYPFLRELPKAKTQGGRVFGFVVCLQRYKQTKASDSCAV